jgi:hypothetical protein
MGSRAKSVFLNKVVVGLVLALLVSLYLYHQWANSVVMREKDRINIAVFAKTPFVYSYNVAKKMAVVVYFNPNYLVNVPGGYSWYKVGSLNLLGKIENKRGEILKQAFAELVGVPIDFVYYPKKAVVVEGQPLSFENFFSQLTQKTLFSSQYQHSAKNLFDSLLIRHQFRVRGERIVFVDTAELAVKEQNRWRYFADKLDVKLKGMFYYESFLQQLPKARIYTSVNKFSEAQLVLRRLEGMGVKVIDIQTKSNHKSKQCLLLGSREQKEILKKIARLFNCQTKEQSSSIISYTL